MYMYFKLFNVFRKFIYTTGDLILVKLRLNYDTDAHAAIYVQLVFNIHFVSGYPCLTRDSLK
jgi:hypothetical protein